MSDLILISVVIPTYGRPDSLEQAIATIAQQSFTQWEIIIVDDNPPDSQNRRLTAELMQKHVSAKIKYLQLPDNSGACVARNTGLAAASADIVAFLDDDDVWHRDKLKKCLAQFDADAHLDILIHNVRQLYRGTEEIQDFDVKGDFFGYFINNGAGVSCSAITVRKHSFDNVSGFDPELASYQDLDLMLRMAKQGKAKVLREVLMDYQLSDTGITFNPAKKVAGGLRILSKFAEEFDSAAGKIGKRQLLAKQGDYYMMLGDASQAKCEYQSSSAMGEKGVKMKVKSLLATLNWTWMFRILMATSKRIKT